MTLSCFLVPALNSVCFLKIYHRTKIIFSGSVTSISYILFPICFILPDTMGIGLFLILSFVIGGTQAVAEMTVLGFLKGIHEEAIAGWGVGTGLSGVIGILFVFILQFLRQYIGFWVFVAFGLGLGIGLILIFNRILELKIDFERRLAKALKEHKNITIDESSTPVDEIGPEFVHQNKKQKAIIEKIEASENLHLSFNSFKTIFGTIGSVLINMGITYFLEYTIIISFLERATKPLLTLGNSYWEKNAYKLTLWGYNLGVFLSRSSIFWIKLTEGQITLVTIIQLINLIVFASIAYNLWASLSILFILSVWTGSFGGLSSVNCYFRILESKTLSKNLKELAVNFSGIIIEMGIFLSSLVGAAISNTVLKSKG